LKDQRSGGNPLPSLREALRRFNIKLVVTLASLIIIFLSVFRLLKTFDLYIPAIILYSAITLGVAFYYIIYNRGNISGKVTPDMLPLDWSADKKQAFIDDLAERRKKSKWALLILIPMIIVFGFEILELYFFPMFGDLFSAGE